MPGEQQFDPREATLGPATTYLKQEICKGLRYGTTPPFRYKFSVLVKVLELFLTNPRLLLPLGGNLNLKLGYNSQTRAGDFFAAVESRFGMMALLLCANVDKCDPEVLLESNQELERLFLDFSRLSGGQEFALLKRNLTKALGFLERAQDEFMAEFERTTDELADLALQAKAVAKKGFWKRKDADSYEGLIKQKVSILIQRNVLESESRNNLLKRMEELFKDKEPNPSLISGEMVDKIVQKAVHINSDVCFLLDEVQQFLESSEFEERFVATITQLREKYSAYLKNKVAGASRQELDKTLASFLAKVKASRLEYENKAGEDLARAFAGFYGLRDALLQEAREDASSGDQSGERSARLQKMLGGIDQELQRFLEFTRAVKKLETDIRVAMETQILKRIMSNGLQSHMGTESPNKLKQSNAPSIDTSNFYYVISELALTFFLNHPDAQAQQYELRDIPKFLKNDGWLRQYLSNRMNKMDLVFKDIDRCYGRSDKDAADEMKELRWNCLAANEVLQVWRKEIRLIEEKKKEGPVTSYIRDMTLSLESIYKRIATFQQMVNMFDLVGTITPGCEFPTRAEDAERQQGAKRERLIPSGKTPEQEKSRYNLVRTLNRRDLANRIQAARSVERSYIRTLRMFNRVNLEE
ncbi:MAG: hypothetical protein HQK60_01570 [Deltaproteobacteria bacterium]|nr:hypothetical protein [Deltaproteobacteria bacterium]